MDPTAARSSGVVPLTWMTAWLLLINAGCTAETNFSQYPGFAEYFAGHPPSPSAADPRARALLERHRPRFFLPPAHAGMIDFYGDYIASGELTGADGRMISARTSRAQLNLHRDDPRVEFRHRPDQGPRGTPVVYARIDRDYVRFNTDSGAIRIPFTFLTYHAVFRHSGLPAGLSAVNAFVIDLVADPDDWHQLDHYTAATLVLADGGRPVAVMLQQHNYLHTYLVGEEITLPPDGRLQVDVAVRSNELYPHARERRRRRAVRFTSFEGMAYLLGFGPQPLIAADDITEGAAEAEYRLDYLPPSDAFYMSQGFLGERRLLPGRSGPPGAAYNTLPALKPLGIQLMAGYWREGNAGDWRRWRETREAGEAMPGFARRQSAVFHHNWRCLERRRAGCRLQ
ncbi:MAG: hypothetical protein R3174_11630 [Gammaproteobacteria bacterium]|nr:hypothetical protein [Gammaproteobacteria bacterium]